MMSKERARIRQLMNRTPGEWDDLRPPDAPIYWPKEVRELTGQDVWTLYWLRTGDLPSGQFLGHFPTKEKALESVEIGNLEYWSIWCGDRLVTYHQRR